MGGDGEGRRPVEMVVIPREEVLYEREVVMGRDASSVFPTHGKQQGGLGGFTKEACAAALGASALKFVSEKELEEIRISRGPRADDGSLAVPSRPLSIILAENKEKKDAEFQAMWTQMKTGKNRPLDAEEAAFLEDIDKKEKADADQRRAWEDQEMAQFQLQRAEMQTSSLPEPEGIPAAGPTHRPTPPLAAAPAPRPAARSIIVKARAKGAAAPPPGELGSKRPRPADDNGDEERRSKPAAATDVLTGLAGYGSEDDDS